MSRVASALKGKEHVAASSSGQLMARTWWWRRQAMPGPVGEDSPLRAGDTLRWKEPGSLAVSGTVPARNCLSWEKMNLV